MPFLPLFLSIWVPFTLNALWDNRLTILLVTKIYYSSPVITELPQAIAATTDSEQVPCCIVQSLNDLSTIGLHWSVVMPELVIMAAIAVPTTTKKK